MTNDLTAIKEERDCIRESNRDLGKKLSLLSQDYLSLKEKCRMQLTTIDQLKEEMDGMQESLKTTHSVRYFVDINLFNKFHKLTIYFKLQLG